MSAAATLCRHDTPADELAERLAEDGYVIVESLAPALIRRARGDLAPHIEDAPYGHVPFLGFRTKRVGGLLAKSGAVRELAIHPTVLGLADRMLLPHCARYQLNFSGIMHLAPGAEAQPLHRDGGIYPLTHPHPPTIMPTMWALGDFRGDNGATRIVPGSHHWEQERTPYEDEILTADMPAGSVLVYTCGVLHGGGDNRSDDVRTGLALQYALGWLRQEENQYLVNPPRDRARVPGEAPAPRRLRLRRALPGLRPLRRPAPGAGCGARGAATTFQSGSRSCSAADRMAALRRDGARGDTGTLRDPRRHGAHRCRRLKGYSARSPAAVVGDRLRGSLMHVRRTLDGNVIVRGAAALRALPVPASGAS